MKKIIILILLTIAFPILNYFILKYNISNFLVMIYYLFLIFTLKIYKLKPNIKFEFNSIFIKYLGSILLLQLFTLLIFNNKTDVDFSIFTILKLIVIIVIPFLEEVFFRFYIFEYLKEFSDKKIILISSFLFTVAHVVVSDGLLFIFIGSLILTIYYYKTKNLLMVYIIHLLNNFFVFCVI